MRSFCLAVLALVAFHPVRASAVDCGLFLTMPELAAALESGGILHAYSLILDKGIALAPDVFTAIELRQIQARGLKEFDRFFDPPSRILSGDSHLRHFRAGLAKLRISVPAQLRTPALAQSLSLLLQERFLQLESNGRALGEASLGVAALPSQLRRVLKHSGPVKSVEFVAGGLLVTLSQTDGVQLWDPDGKLIRRLDSLVSVHGLWVSPQGERIAYTDALSGAAWIVDLEGNVLATLQPKTGVVGEVAFSPDGQRIATGSTHIHSASYSTNGRSDVQIWNPTGKLVATLPHLYNVGSLSFSSDSRKLVSASGENSAKVWRRGGALIKNLSQDLKGAITAVAFFPTGNRLAVGGYERVSIWRPSDMQPLLRIHTEGAPRRILISSDSKHLLTQQIEGGQPFGKVRLYKVSGERVAHLEDRVGYSALCFSPSGRLVAVGNEHGHISIWSVEGMKLETFRVHDRPVTQVRFSPDGLFIASSSEDHTVNYWALPEFGY
jgi:WD40 repeat protein